MKIVADNQPRQYELTYLVSSEYTDKELAEVTSQVQSLIAKLKGEIISTQEWGKKYLAYSILHQGKRFQEAVYTHLVISLLPEQAQELERQLQLNTHVIRNLVVKADSPQEPDAQPEQKG